MVARDELIAAWKTICQTSKDGDIVVSRKKGEWKAQITAFMDAGIAHEIVTYMADMENGGGEDWTPNMFEGHEP